jgi:pimeloyl-ACP methyl ester carboxylesterase
MQTLVFVHGGPGLTTVPEERWFRQGLDAAGIRPLFWNEPSRTRPDGPPFQEASAFTSAVASLADTVRSVEQPTYVCHSTGVHYLLALPHEVLSRTRRLVLVSPSLALKETLRKIAELAAADLEREASQAAAALRQHVANSRALFDPSMAAAFQLALSDPLLLTHYWRDPAAMNRWLDVSQQPGAGLDIDCLFAVLREMSETYREDLSHLRRVDVTATLVMGDADPLLDPSTTLRLAGQIFSTVRPHLFPGCAHFPHLERTTDFERLLVELAH